MRSRCAPISNQNFPATSLKPSLVVGLSHFSRATVVGGLPITVDGEVIGGIGGGTVEQDIDCAKAGLKVLD